MDKGLKGGKTMKSRLFYWVMVVSLILPAFSMAEEMTAEKVIQRWVDSYQKTLYLKK